MVNSQIVIPKALCRFRLYHKRWHKCQGWILTVEGQHALDVALGKAFFFGQLIAQVVYQAGNHASPPAFFLLPAPNRGGSTRHSPPALSVSGHAGALLDDQQAGILNGKRRVCVHVKVIHISNPPTIF
nr:hypothetical protein [Candidatus Methylobacter oryzae]